jgi:hypothetical protein
VRLKEMGTGMGWLHPHPYPAGAIPISGQCLATVNEGTPTWTHACMLKEGFVLYRLKAEIIVKNKFCQWLKNMEKMLTRSNARAIFLVV